MIVRGEIVVDFQPGDEPALGVAVVRDDQHAPIVRAELDLLLCQRLAFKGQRERRAQGFGREIFYMDHDFGGRAPVRMPSHLQTDNGEVVHAAGDVDEAQLIAGLREFLGARESPVADDHDAVRAAAFEKSMGEKNGIFHPSRRIGRLQAACQFPKPALIGGERDQQARLRPGADHHHFLPRAEAVDQRRPLAPCPIEARCAPFLRLHAGAQVDDNNQVTGGGAKIAEPWIGKSGDKRRCSDDLQDE